MPQGIPGLSVSKSEGAHKAKCVKLALAAIAVFAFLFWFATST